MINHKRLALLLIVCFLLCSSVALAGPAGINFQFNDKPAHFNYPIELIDGQAMVAVNDIAGKMGLTVSYGADGEQVNLSNAKYGITFTLYSYLATVNKKVYPLSVMPQVINEQFYVPLKVTVENAGGIVTWNAKGKTVNFSLPGQRVVIFHAGSLAVPLQEIVTKYRETHPNVGFVLESAGSVDCVNKVVNLERNADIIASADYTVFEKFMFPKYANWYLNFAKNQMVIVYNDKAKLQDKISSMQWYDILLNSDVKFGRTNSDKDPAGYRALMVWQLAEKHYGQQGLYDKLDRKCTATTVYDSASDLIKALNEGKIDYAFEYLSVAQQNKLKYITLPPEIDLSAAEQAEFYSQAKVISAGKEQVAVPIINSLTIPVTATQPNAAIDFIKFIVSPEGQAILTKNGQIVISPPQVNDSSKLPTALQGIIK